MSSWFKLSRSILDFEWISDANTFRLWIILLAMCNYRKTKFLQHSIMPGQVALSLTKLAMELVIDKKTIYRALENLKKTGQIRTSKIYVGNRSITLITIVKWGHYQRQMDQETDRQTDRVTDQVTDQVPVRSLECLEFKNKRTTKKPAACGADSFVGDGNGKQLKGSKVVEVSQEQIDWMLSQGAFLSEVGSGDKDE